VGNDDAEKALVRNRTYRKAGVESWKVAQGAIVAARRASRNAVNASKDASKAAAADAAKMQAVARVKKRPAPRTPTRGTVPPTRSPPALASAEKNRRKSKPDMQEPRG
jgi:hypothetical protein